MGQFPATGITREEATKRGGPSSALRLVGPGEDPRILSPYRKTLPALDRRPRTAIVTGREIFNPEPDPDSFTSTYELVTVRVDVDGVATDTMIADIIAAEDLDRFAVGSVWNVYAFELSSSLAGSSPSS